VTSTEAGSGDTVEQTPDELRAGIEQTREELGETIEALTAKLDVKSRAKNRLGRAREEAATHLQVATRQSSQLTSRAMDRVSTASGGTDPRTLAIVALVAVLLTTLGIGTWRHRRG
jgi:flagellar capping protein FliD